MAAACPAKVKNCVLQRGREAKELCTLPKILSLICSTSIYLHEFTHPELNLSAGLSLGTAMGAELRQEEQLVPRHALSIPCEQTLSALLLISVPCVPSPAFMGLSPLPKLFSLCHFCHFHKRI